jgi:GNAT superfamily N-acetyltransferase
MNLPEKRHAIRPLLDERAAKDAIDAYYAFHHPDRKTQLITYPADVRPAEGYICLSRTGLDLFRPLMTCRLPAAHEQVSDLIYQSLPPGAGLFISAPEAYRDILLAFFDVQQEQHLLLYQLDPGNFQPEINVLVFEEMTPDALPRYIIRATNAEFPAEAAAWAGLNWQSPYFAEIAVGTRPQYRQRGWGRSVVAALSQHVLRERRAPLYLVAEENHPSISLAISLGFHYTGARRLLLEATLRPPA